MKNILSILSFFFLCHSSFAQTYQYVPMPTSGVKWKAHILFPYIRSSACMAYQYDLTGVDTTVGADTFHQIRMLTVHLSSPGPYTSCTRQAEDAFATPLPENPSPGYLWFIEIDRRVYLLDSLPLDTTNHIPYLDFNLDSVGQRFGENNLDSVVSIDTINVQGSLRKRMIVRVMFNYPYGGAVDTIVEGIGGYRFGLGFDELFEIGMDNRLYGRVVCMSINGQPEYTFSNASCNVDIWPLTVDELDGEDNLPVYPNPFNTTLNIRVKSGYTISVYNSTGALMHNETYTGFGLAEINTGNWPAGLYLVITDDGEDKSIQKVAKY